MKNNKLRKQLNKQPKKTDKNWLIFFLIVGVFLILASIVSNIVSKKMIPIQENTWRGVTPGYKFTKEIQNKLGKPLKTTKIENGTEYSYRSEFKVYPNTIIVSNDNTVEFVKEYLTYDPTHTLDLYINKLGEPQLTLNAPQIGNSTKAYVFLNDGLVIFAHIADNSVEEKWYFKPVDKDEFLKTWGKELLKQKAPF